MSLKRQAVKGITWTSIGTLGPALFNLLITIVLARLLTPSDFGIIELLIIFSTISDIIVDSGFSQAIIRDENATTQDLSSVFWLNLCVAFIIYGILFLSSPYIAKFYDTPIMETLSKVLFLIIIFNSLSIVQNANLSRKLLFQPYALASIYAVIISGTLAIYIAYSGYGVWALCINLTALSFFRMLFIWILSKWVPCFSFSIKSIRKYFSFGVNLLIQGLLDRIVTNLESLVIGKIYTKQQLGYFSQGRKLDSYVTQSANNIISKVTYPVLSKVKEDDIKLRENYRTIVRAVICVMSPIMCVLFFGAEMIMNGIFGHQWIQASQYLRLWSVCGWCLILYSIFINIFLVKGRSKQLLYCSIAKQILRITCVIIFARISILSLMYGLVVSTLISSLIYIYWGGRLISYSFINLLQDVALLFIFSVTSGIIADFFIKLIGLSNDIPSLILLTTILIVTYLSFLLMIKDKTLYLIISILKRA